MYTLVLFDDQEERCLNKFSLELFNDRTGASIPIEPGFMDEPKLAFDPLLRQISCEASADTQTILGLRLDIITDKGTLRNSLLYELEIMPNTPPVFV